MWCRQPEKTTGRFRGGAGVILPLFLCLLALSLGWAGELTLEERISREEESLRRVRAQLSSRRERFEETLQREQSLLETLDSLDGELEVKRRELLILEFRLAQARRKISGIEAKIKEVQTRLALRETELSGRLRALYKGGRALGEPLFLLGKGTAEATLFQEYARRVAEHDLRLMAGVRAERAERGRLLAEAEAEAGRLETHRAEGARQRMALEAARREKAKLLAFVRGERVREGQAYRELQAAADRLQAILDEWKGGPSGRGFGDLGEGDLGGSTPGRAEGFFEKRGRLPWPVSGRLADGRRVRLASWPALSSRPGVHIMAEVGAGVRAVDGGKVLYADWLRGYGNLLILDHGAHYYTVYGHAGELLVQVGDTLRPGQDIARIGESGPFGTPTLYFEVRYRGRPENPLEWLTAAP